MERPERGFDSATLSPRRLSYWADVPLALVAGTQGARTDRRKSAHLVRAMRRSSRYNVRLYTPATPAFALPLMWFTTASTMCGGTDRRSFIRVTMVRLRS